MGAIPQANQQNVPMSSTAVTNPLTYISGLAIGSPTPTPTIRSVTRIGVLVLVEQQ